MSNRALAMLGRLWLGLILFFLYAPILVMAAMSFNASEFYQLPFSGTSVDTLREPLTIAGAGIGGASGAIRIGSGATDNVAEIYRADGTFAPVSPSSRFVPSRIRSRQ